MEEKAESRRSRNQKSGEGGIAREHMPVVKETLRQFSR